MNKEKYEIIDVHKEEQELEKRGWTPRLVFADEEEIRELAKNYYKALLDIKEYIKNDNIDNTYGYIDASYMKKAYKELSDIVNKALGDNK